MFVGLLGRRVLHFFLFFLLAGPVAFAADLNTAGQQSNTEPSPTGKKVEVGVASWYGTWHQGRRTASGEDFDMNSLTAAHRTLPLNTRVIVTNLNNGKSVSVRINDRGPYLDGRDLDLSERAAEEIGMKATGLAPVAMAIVH
ncbi:MAG: rare lipoprotein [Rhodospirillales bacterium]|jgi:rare lipoprotein A|nr:rare lipoprotein [Rhodospirillales bacterium]